MKKRRLVEKSMFLYGRNSVLERINSKPSTIKKIFLQDNFDAPLITKRIKDERIPAGYVSPRKLFGLKHSKDLQGIVAEVKPFKYMPFEELISEQDNQRSLIFLDRLYDPQNLGVIMRITACFGNFAIIIPKHNACKITEAVLHVASGGENFVPVALVSNLLNAIIKAKKYGYWIVGTVIKEGADISETKFLFPLGIVLGSEGRGIRCGLSKLLDSRVHIPMEGAALSLNVAMACAIFCYEIANQRKGKVAAGL